MYTPAAFRQDDLATLHQQIRATRLPTLISHGKQGLRASHLPLLLETDEGPYGTLYGHFARANPQWRDLADGNPALVIFQGAEAYISPSWYAAKAEHGKVVPTWNYISVQAHGRAEVFDDAERPQPWAISDAPREYIDSMLRAIVGFALPIERLEGKWKLGQNRSQADQNGVREGLHASHDPRDRELAAYISTDH
ncbi:FMN-binding negative transcriptional regulator [Pseudomonas anguilliseptica]|uniref:Negative transcriptional regulator, PaiB family n=1 Tax=Pseudomonas anguilliseptica TaxID=53406 RepID=A0A1H4TY54_PSEAG|nr:FMN-binding negative transcriptional regulator [Pseudomonas anguilliseptica]SEC61415.1 negative transcriptional regulator, PaiB family [Pseudomonas anguilliseptica]